MSAEIMEDYPATGREVVAINDSTLAQLESFIERAVLKAVTASCDFTDSSLSTRLALSEPEAASLLGVKKHVIRDARLRGEIISTRVGGRISYMRNDLINYLETQKG